MSLFALIMAGGSGTRLWPMSRSARPKQLIPFINGRTLLELAAARMQGLVPPDKRAVCTLEAFRDSVRSALPELHDDRIFGEPVGRDTVNAVALAASIFETIDPDSTFVVLTSDHLIQPEERFRATVQRGVDLVAEDHRRFITFSITPTFPATQYGYVMRGPAFAEHGGASIVERYIEKPTTPEAAQELIDTGRCGWNSGMFVFSGRGFLAALQRYKPDNYARIRRIQEAWNTPAQRDVLEREYPELEKISVDYAIMEPASTDPDFEVCTVMMDVEWIDVGSWPSFAQTLDKDDAGNRAGGATFASVGSTGITAVSDDPDHLIAAVGCENLIIIRTADATLVCHPDHAERVKELAEKVIDERWK